MNEEQIKQMCENRRDRVIPINGGQYWIVDGFVGRYLTRELAVKAAKWIKEHNVHSSDISQHLAHIAATGKLS